MSENHFVELAKINVNEYTEKKNNLTYLSWAWAVDQLLRLDGSATWSYGEPQKWGESVMVFCTVNAFGKSMTAQLPVMNHSNKAIPNPDSFQVNVAMQRCLAKAIALHGLGLYIYAGEDLPEGSEVGPSQADVDRNWILDALKERGIEYAGEGKATILAFLSVGAESPYRNYVEIPPLVLTERRLKLQAWLDKKVKVSILDSYLESLKAGATT